LRFVSRPAAVPEGEEHGGGAGDEQHGDEDVLQHGVNLLAARSSAAAVPPRVRVFVDSRRANGARNRLQTQRLHARWHRGPRASRHAPCTEWDVWRKGYDEYARQLLSIAAARPELAGVVIDTQLAYGNAPDEVARLAKA